MTSYFILSIQQCFSNFFIDKIGKKTYLVFSSKGYLYLGKSVTGHGANGTSILWIYLECVQARDAAVLPWKPPWNERTDRLGVPGAWFIMQDSIATWLKAAPPRTLSMYLKCISLNAFSLEQDPHIMVVTWSRPGGAPAIITCRSWVTQSSPG